MFFCLFDSLVCCLRGVVMRFFFFKQKTAYEMRISDWSPDVCSSDLATPVNKAMMAIKGRNAIIVAPSPSGYTTTAKTVDYMRQELARIGLPADLVQILPSPVTKQATQALMRAVDLVVVTGSQNNVRAAYSSGTPAIGVGAGNVPVIIDASADLEDAAEKIFPSKIVDNATSCPSGNSVPNPQAVHARP